MLAATEFFASRLRSLRCAAAGVLYVLRSQKNACVHATATGAVVLAGVALQLGGWEWCWLIAAIAAVWMAEAFNTALELLCDAACPQFHPLIGRAKDAAAAGVLLTALAATAIGGIILLPHLLP